MRVVFDRVRFIYESFGRRRRAPSRSRGGVDLAAFALQDISFQLTSAESVAILGRSGSGKSTLMSLFTGLIRPAQGRISVDDEDLGAATFSLSRLRQRIGLVFQFPESQLFELSVFEDVAFGPRHLGLPESEVRERVEAALAAVGLAPDFASADPLHLSQGEKRRAAIAGVLAMQPEMLIMDEPTAGLDAAGRDRLVTNLRALLARGLGLVLITHDTSLATQLTSRALVLEQGRLVFDDQLSTLLQDAKLTQSWGLERPRAVRLLQRMQQLQIPEADAKALLREAIT